MYKNQATTTIFLLAAILLVLLVGRSAVPWVVGILAIGLVVYAVVSAEREIFSDWLEYRRGEKSLLVFLLSLGLGLLAFYVLVVIVVRYAFGVELWWFH